MGGVRKKKSPRKIFAKIHPVARARKKNTARQVIRLILQTQQ